MKKVYVIDTNVFLTNYESLYSFKNNDIVIPLKVIDEIDNHKKRQDGVGLNARAIIRILDDLRAKGNLHKGVRIAKGKGMLSIRTHDKDLLPTHLDLASADNQIIGTAMTEKNRTGRKVILVSQDINMRVKCDALGIYSEDYVSDQVVASATELYSGFTEHLVDERIVDRFYAGEDITGEMIDGKFHPNEFVMLISNSNSKHTALAKNIDDKTPLK